MNAQEVCNAICQKFSDSRQYAIATEVGLTTGGSRRRIDMVIVNCYNSNSFRIDGIEIKVSKADLRRELEDPDKHVAFFELIDYYTLACPKGIADLNLLPPKWGLIEVDERGAWYRRKPLALHDEVNRTVTRGFFAGYVRAIQQYSPSKEALNAEYRRGFDDGINHEKRRFAFEQERLTKNIDKLDRLDELERRFRLWGDNYDERLEAFERFQKADTTWMAQTIKRAVEQLTKLLGVLEGDAK